MKNLIKLWSLSEINLTSKQSQTMTFVSGPLGKEREISPLKRLSQQRLTKGTQRPGNQMTVHERLE